MVAKTVIEDMLITNIDLDMTNDCVLRCDYCFRGDKDKHRLTWETGTKAIDFLIQNSGNAKSVGVAVFGGEPLLEYKLLKKIVCYAEQKAAYYGKSFHFNVTTNGVLLTDEMIQFLRQHRINLLISVDGDAESHDKHRHFPDGSGSHAIIEPKIHKALKYWPHMAARATVSPDTVHLMFKNVLYFAKTGYKHMGLQPVIEGDWTEEHFKCLQAELRKISDFYIEGFRTAKVINIRPLEDFIKGIINPSRPRYSCGAGRASILIKTDGSIYPCHRFGRIEDPEACERWRLGSIFDGIDKERRKEFLNYDCANAKADCENCIAVHTCRVWCIAANGYYCGDINIPHPNQCRFMNIHFSEAMRVHYILENEKNENFMNYFYKKPTQNVQKPQNVTT